MTTRETIIDESGRYVRRFYGTVIARSDDRYEVIDPDGKLVTEIGAPVVFDTFGEAEAFLKRRNR